MNMVKNFIAMRLFAEVGWKAEDVWTMSISYLNDKGWKLSWVKRGGWHLLSWNNTIYCNDIWSRIELFTYGLVLSTLRITAYMQVTPRIKSSKQNVNVNYICPSADSIIETFAKLTRVSQKLFECETRMARPGRAKAMYSVYKKKLYTPEKKQDYQDFAILYEEKLILDATLKHLTNESINKLKISARSLELIKLHEDERLPTSLSFLFTYLKQSNISWYKVNEQWHYFEGIQLIFSFSNTDDFEAFFFGMTYNYARLSDKVLESIT